MSQIKQKKYRPFIYLILLLTLLLGGTLVLGFGRSHAQPRAPKALNATCSANYCLNKQVLGGGIGTMSSAQYQLRGTLGQPITGLFSSENYALSAGYWTPFTGAFEIYIPIAVEEE